MSSPNGPLHWRKLGIVWSPDGHQAWARSHAMLPTPFVLSDGTVRVFVSCWDDQGRGRPGYVDLDPRDSLRVVGAASEPLLDLGQPGSFDDAGVIPCSAISMGGQSVFMYYAGFERCTSIRYRIFTGLAISQDGGHSFVRHSQAPVLDRSDAELYFRCAPFAVTDGGRVRLWYVGGGSWTEVGGKQVPVYDLRYLESEDGLAFASRGRCIMQLDREHEHGFGRPWVVQNATDRWELFYSIRRRREAAYRLGYAVSSNGLDWRRRDADLGLGVSKSGFDANAIMYSAVVRIGDRRYCFYNGDDFGRAGFGVAVLD